MRDLWRPERAIPLVVLLALAMPAPVQAAAHRHRVALRPCTVPGVPGPVRCGHYEVYENRSTRRGRRLSLNVIVLEATGAHPAPDPIFYLTGGPGEGASDDAAFFGTPAWAPVRRHRAIVLVDQRGTGRSHRLTCDLGGAGAAARALYAFDISAGALRRCRDRLAAHADLRQYTTPVAMDDLDEVRAALGYERIDLYGASYGTRAALVYLRRHPRHVRAVILRAIAPTDMKALLPSARDAQRAFDGVVADCHADAGCAAAFPHLRSELGAVLARLARAPVPVTVRDPVTGRPDRILLTRDVFAGALTWMMAAPEGAAAVPRILQAAAAGNFGPITTAAMPLAVVAGGRWGLGMALAVICSEDAARIDPHQVATATRGTFMGPGRVENELRVCRGWPQGRLPEDYWAPVRSAVPVLMISGQYDPIDGIELAREVAQTLPNALQVVVPHVGHHPQFPGCTMALATRFLDQGSTRGLDPACAARVRRPPWRGVPAHR